MFSICLLLNFIAHHTFPFPSGRRDQCYYFLPKKAMIFPCPALAVDLLPFALKVAGAFALGGGGASSSEKDSQAGSSFVTVMLLELKYENLGED
jgi:hypothetical protein